MKRNPVIVVAGLVAALSLAVTGCASGAPATSAPASTAGTSAAPAADREYKIGISQYVSHASLDAARDGFKEALADAGLKVTYDEKNAQTDAATNTTIATTFASADLDLVLAIATPSAQAAAQAIADTPVLFTAVTDPVAAKLVASADAPGANVTGTSDMNPVAEQIALIKKLKPEARTVGIIYSSGEVNSEVQVAAAKEAAAKEGLEVVERTITTTAEVQQAANALEVDAIYVPTDNNVVSALESVVQVAETKQIPLVVGEGDSVAKGGIITYGLDYTKLGYQTGEMAIKVLKGEAQPATMPVETLKDLKVYVNKAAAERMGITVPADLLDGAEVVG
ncbi:ABC transporter substrate-binding protein [Propioniciclava sinopodophylli]|uniref:ABC transporter substrate-binding protein n=1 Tax=Propioniciclava sinopodophylli TaxID=1837344 RepID=A0A4Q9KGV0_9ACTN|nr:ABC transporter substrate-binding protein [Propioniciclava sinopodophylli]TBT86637.1 ABC transporter substrate-binding protein [Propioniciclava sinopodophylli]